MSEFLQMVISAYAVFLIFDVTRAFHKYDQHKFLNFGVPEKRWHYFFIKEHKWSIGAAVVFGLIGFYLFKF
jgi:hypothetical protein